MPRRGTEIVWFRTALRKDTVAGLPFRRHRHLHHDVHRVVHQADRAAAADGDVGEDQFEILVIHPAVDHLERHDRLVPQLRRRLAVQERGQFVGHPAGADRHRVDGEPAGDVRLVQVADRNAAIVQVDRERSLGGGHAGQHRGGVLQQRTAHLRLIWIFCTSGPLGKLNSIGAGVSRTAAPVNCPAAGGHVERLDLHDAVGHRGLHFRRAEREAEHLGAVPTERRGGRAVRQRERPAIRRRRGPAAGDADVRADAGTQQSGQAFQVVVELPFELPVLLPAGLRNVSGGGGRHGAGGQRAFAKLQRLRFRVVVALGGQRTNGSWNCLPAESTTARLATSAVVTPCTTPAVCCNVAEPVSCPASRQGTAVSDRRTTAGCGRRRLGS